MVILSLLWLFSLQQLWTANNIGFKFDNIQLAFRHVTVTKPRPCQTIYKIRMWFYVTVESHEDVKANLQWQIVGLLFWGYETTVYLIALPSEGLKWLMINEYSSITPRRFWGFYLFALIFFFFLDRATPSTWSWPWVSDPPASTCGVPQLAMLISRPILCDDEQLNLRSLIC